MKAIYFDGMLDCGAYIANAKVTVPDNAEKYDIVKAIRAAGYVSYVDPDEGKLVSTDVELNSELPAKMEAMSFGSWECAHRYYITYIKNGYPLVTYASTKDSARDIAGRLRGVGYTVQVWLQTRGRIQGTAL